MTLDDSSEKEEEQAVALHRQTERIIREQLNAVCNEGAAAIHVSMDLESASPGDVVIAVSPRRSTAAPIKVFVGPDSDQVLLLVASYGQFELDARPSGYHMLGQTYAEELAAISKAVFSGKVEEEWRCREDEIVYASTTVLADEENTITSTGGWKALARGIDSQVRSYDAYC